jgi:DNA primase
MGLSPQWLDELRARTTLSALIGRTVRITKAGREYKACCPFHDEKSPSFTINDEKGFYHCFGCSAHGDAIRWMTDQRGLSFMDAIKELAAQAGMDVPAPDPKAAKQAEKQAGLHDVMAAAQDWFVEQLGSVEGAVARDYLKIRDINFDTILQFGIGFSPNNKSSLRNALKQFGDDLLIEAGLLIKVDGKEPYDRFRGRLMIPIRDARGRVIAFGGRILGAGEPKYLNSPDTPLFDKGRTLYNLNKASPASRKTNNVIVVEGYMDVIAMAQAGFHDVVAPLGTALTEQQIQMLWRMAEKPVICFDGDAAGQKASQRAAERALPLLQPGYTLKFAKLPIGQDPDDFLKAHGQSKMADRILRSISLDEQIYQFERTKITNDKPGPDDRAALKDRLQKIAKSIENPIIAKEYSIGLMNSFFDEFGFKKKNIVSLSTAMKAALQLDINPPDYLTHRAVFLGLSRYPAVIRTHFSQILALPFINDEIQAMKDLLVRTVMEQPDVEVDILEQMWATQIDPPIRPRDLAKDLAFSFFKRHLDTRKPEYDLGLVICAIIEFDEIDRAILVAKEKLELDWDEANYSAYYELQQEKVKLRDELITKISVSSEFNNENMAA